jgi:hypothetical protein
MMPSANGRFRIYSGMRTIPTRRGRRRETKWKSRNSGETICISLHSRLRVMRRRIATIQPEELGSGSQAGLRRLLYNFVFAFARRDALMKKRRLLRVGSAMALLLGVGLVAACPDDQAGQEPAVQQEQPPAEPAPGEPAPGEPTAPPETQQPDETPPPAETPPGQEPGMDEEHEEDMDQEPTQPPR